jgi:hypothetical protein
MDTLLIIKEYLWLISFVLIITALVVSSLTYHLQKSSWRLLVIILQLAVIASNAPFLPNLLNGVTIALAFIVIIFIRKSDRKEEPS